MENVSLDTICGALCEIMGVEKPEAAASGNSQLIEYAEAQFNGNNADRIFMYNPDAIARWIYNKYPNLLKEAINRTELTVEIDTVMPSVTPVCFATMYTGTQPCVHGIRKYEKPVLEIDTIFDALISSGKKPVIIAESKSSIAEIFLNRDMDYFIYDTIEEVNAKTVQVITEDKYDFIVVYNGNYDSLMHKWGPEGVNALAELRANSEIFGVFSVLIEKYWKNHNSLVGFAMDHGCHEIDGECGSHGLDMDEDIKITHLYKAYPKNN